MIRVSQSKEPAWHDLGVGVRLLCRPVTTAIVRAAGAAAGAGEFPDPEVLSVRVFHLYREIALRVIVDWEGVGDLDGLPVAARPEWIGACMDQPRFADAFERVVLTPWLLMQSEKKDSAPSPDGNSARAPLTTAPSATVSAPSALPS